jgi:hypothetical protein
MKMLSWLCAATGIVVLLLAVYGRFHSAPSITIMGHGFAGSTVLLGTNTLLLLSVVFGLHGRKS